MTFSHDVIFIENNFKCNVLTSEGHFVETLGNQSFVSGHLMCHVGNPASRSGK